MSKANTPKKFQYIGQRYKQGSSPLELISFCASAKDIHKWGGVPAKSDRFHGGFQRALSDRYKSIKKYFDDGQASPTSIVVAFREGALSVSPIGYPASWPDASKLNQHPEYVHISFESKELSPEEHTLDDLRKSVCAMLKPRLVKSVQTTGEETSEEAEEEGEENENNEEQVDVEQQPENVDEPAELDVGHSKLRQFYDFIASDERVTAWIEAEKASSIEKQKEKKSKKDNEFLDATPEEKLKSLLVSLLRPAMIVDGQHRVWGAYHSDKSPLYFNVCAIKDADWVEQVFQFVVLNKLAKPISPSFLTSILNTSLTNAEVQEIEKRLDNIGIRNTDRIIIKYLNLDDRSPFYGLISEPGEVTGIDNKGKMSDKGMIRLAKRWLNIRTNKKEIEMFQTALGAKNITEARGKWGKPEIWVPFFYAFWKAIKDKYEKDGMWEKKEGYHLLYIVTMHAMQDMFIEAKSKADIKFKNLQDFVEQVNNYFKDVSGTFFQGWEATGLQSGERHIWIKNAIEDLRSGTKLSTLQENSPLYKKTK